MADPTPRLTANYWIINQPYPFVPYNRSLGRLDGLVQATVINETTNDPPDPIVDGAQYIIGSAPTGVWTGHALAIAYGYQKQWLITTPIEGFLVFNQDTNKFRYFDGAAWQDLTAGGGGVTSVSGILGVVATPEPITSTGTVEVDQAITFWTKDDEHAKLAAARQVVAGTNITLDYSVAHQVTVNAAAAASTPGPPGPPGEQGPEPDVYPTGYTVVVPAPNSGIPINTQTGNYTLVLGDAGYCIYRDGANAANTWTIPANASVAFPIGTVVMFDNRDTSTNTTIAITTDTLVYTPGGSTGSRTLLLGGSRAFAHKVTSTVWHISGTGVY